MFFRKLLARLQSERIFSLTIVFRTGQENQLT